MSSLSLGPVEKYVTQEAEKRNIGKSAFVQLCVLFYQRMQQQNRLKYNLTQVLLGANLVLVTVVVVLVL